VNKSGHPDRPQPNELDPQGYEMEAENPGNRCWKLDGFSKYHDDFIGA
jgi:hypothetical protein